MVRHENGDNFVVAQSFEEVQQLRKQIEEDEAMAAKMQAENQQTPGFAPDPERQRSSLMLEEGDAAFQ